MSDKEVFMTVTELGDLYLYDVLLAYIYPRVFVCEDIYDSKYLFYEVGSKENKDTWVVAKLTKKEYYSLVDRKKAIQKAYEHKRGFELFSITKTYGDNEDIVELAYDAKEWIKKLPVEPVFAEKEILDDVIQETLAVARETGATTFDIRLFSGTDRHFVPQNIMSDLCAAMTSLTSSVFGQKRGEALRVATAQGSCIVRFSFPEQINLFNESDAANEMNVINDILLSESISAGLEKVKDQTKFIRSYSKILDSIRKTNSDVQFTTASPNSTEVKKVEMTKEMVRSRYDDVKDIRRVETTSVVLKGSLIALDVKTKRFKLQLSDGSIKSGVVTNEFLAKGSFEIPKDYEATVDVEKLYTDNKSNYKENYCLRDLHA